MFRTNRGLLKFLLLSFITLGIYGIVVMTHISMEIDTIASPRDHKNTMNYLLVFFFLGPITLGIYTLIWNHNLSNRIGDELKARNLGYEFGAGDFWGWGILGSLILIGPFVFVHKLLKSMNLINESYNASL
ncbi:MAG: DUF4234 domain-containing protein [Bacteroidales bacterium]|nr:DUF4234 domain-containing protein [Bacteroidales bacterium]